MKTKLTFLTIAIVTLLGVGMLMAFKQESGKKYAIVRAMNFMGSNSNYNKIFIYKDGESKEYSVVYVKDDTQAAQLKKCWDIIINEVIHDNYELKATTPMGTHTEYIFEKQ